MKGFASNLINRHILTETNIVPRLRGRFETEQNSFHEDVNPAPANDIDTFSERFGADEKGPDADTETSTYRPVANITHRDKNDGRQPDPEPEAPSQVTFNAARAAFTKPAAFEVTPVANNVRPANTNATKPESSTPNEPGSPGKQQIATPYQHNFNTNSPANPVQSNESSLVWHKADVSGNRGETTLFTGKRKSGVAPETGADHGASSVQVNNPVQSPTDFKSLNTGMQNSVNAVLPPNLSSNSMRDGSQKPFGQTAQPVIKVTIGRIEVKAVHPQAPAPVQRREPQKPVLTLDDFLSQHKRNGQ